MHDLNNVVICLKKNENCNHSKKEGYILRKIHVAGTVILFHLDLSYPEAVHCLTSRTHRTRAEGVTISAFY